MQQGSPHHGQPTRLNVRDERANALHVVVLSRRPATVDEIPRLFFSWPREQIETAIADLVADGRLADDEHGRLIVRRTARAT